MSIKYLPQKKLWIMETKNTSFALGLDEVGNLHQLYWGKKLFYEGDYPAADISRGQSSFDSGEGFAPLEYPGWGGVIYSEPCLKAILPGNIRVTSLEYVSHEIGEAGAGERSKDVYGLTVTLKDRYCPQLLVKLYYRVFFEFDLIGKHAEIINGGQSSITLESVQSGIWNLPEGDGYRLTHLTGKWAGETQIRRTTLTEGKKVLESRRGTTSPHANPWFAIDPGNTKEETGEVWFGALCWSGNWKIVAEQSPFSRLKITGGINDFDFSWELGEKDVFETPEFIAGYTDKGFGTASRLMHKYQKKHVLPEGNADKLRKVLYNSWEATYFNVNEADQMALAEKAAATGVELFVIDDGWFGQRNADNAGLGDWYVNAEKFPNGLKPLIEKVNSLGMDFGIWVEPEMVNPDSDLYRKHPDWAYHFQGIPGTQARNQLVLNLAKKEVQEYIYKFLDDLLSGNNISFIKWDMNRHFSEPGWPEAPAEKQKEIWVRHTLAIYDIVKRLKEKHANVIFESCSGGGGRVDLGILQYMDQFWPSDNTDAFDRLKIQEGFSQAYCPKTMVCWVTDSPNYVNGRELPLTYRFHSAMMGSLGVGGNLNHWSAEEIRTAKDMIALYKEIREVVQNGSLYRLLSPSEGNAAAVQYISEATDEVLLFVFLHSSQLGSGKKTVYLRGLEESALYRIDSQEQPLSGAALMYRGLELDIKGDFESRLIRIFRQ